jgi:hypothetical protein
MSNYFMPQIQSSGIFTLKAPFNNALIPQVAYTCIAIRKLSSIVNDGGDPQEEFYTPYGLTDTDYQNDVSADAAIITLQAAGHDTVDVPNTYIEKAPETGGVPYAGLMLAIKIGALPETIDLSVIRQKISDDVLELLGVEATTNVVMVTLPTLIPYDQAKTTEAARQAKIGTVVTDYAKYLQSQTQLASAQQKIAELEAFIRTNISA